MGLGIPGGGERKYINICAGFQANLLASGAAASELYIWDLNSPSTPMTPGAKAQPPEDVSAVAWNRQVSQVM